MRAKREAALVKAQMGRILLHVYEAAQAAESEEEVDAFRLALCLLGYARRTAPCTIEQASFYTFGRSLEKHMAARVEFKAMREAELLACVPDYDREADRHAKMVEKKRERRPEAGTGNLYEIPKPPESVVEEPLRDLPAAAGRAFQEAASDGRSQLKAKGRCFVALGLDDLSPHRVQRHLRLVKSVIGTVPLAQFSRGEYDLQFSNGIMNQTV